MPHHHKPSKHGPDRSRRSSTQHESPLEKLRRKAPRFGHKKDIEWTQIIYPYKDIVVKNIAWVAERPSFADELLKFLQAGVEIMIDIQTVIDGGHFVDRDLSGVRADLQAAYQDKNLEDGILYGFGQHTLSDQKGPEARLLKQFYEYMYYFLMEAKHLYVVQETTTELIRACEIQKAMRDVARSRVEDGHALSCKIKELEKKMQAVKSAPGNMDQLHGIESELEQIDREALQLKTEVNSRYRELEKALKTPRRLWKEKHPDQYQKKSKSVTQEIMSKIKSLSGNSKQSSTCSSESS